MVRKFDDHVRRIVDDFLQTVVLVDDEALPPALTTGVENVTEHDERLDTQIAAPGGAAIVPLNVPTGDGSDGHELPAKEVIDAFADRGLVCSILDPDEAVGERLLRTAARADLLVIDWWLNNNRGERAIQLIRDVLKQDEESGHGRRLRVVAVYTGQPDLKAVADALEGALADVYTDCVLKPDSDGLAMTKGPVRFAVFAKEHVAVAEPSLRATRGRFVTCPIALRRSSPSSPAD